MRVFITGGTTGIGAELARVFQQKGAQVAVCGRSEEKFRKNFGGDSAIAFYQVDVAKREQLLAAIADFSRDGLDIIVANAGTSNPEKNKVPNFDFVHRILEVNVLGVASAFEGALRAMVPAGQGQLVAIASAAGMVGLPGAAAYCGSKAGVIKMCETLSIDLQPLGIHTTCICPGFVDTPLTRKNRHPMPFIVNAPLAAQKIYRAIMKKRPLYIFPWPMRWIVTLLAIIPRNLYFPLMRWLRHSVK